MFCLFFLDQEASPLLSEAASIHSGVSAPERGRLQEDSDSLHSLDISGFHFQALPDDAILTRDEVLLPEVQDHPDDPQPGCSGLQGKQITLHCVVYFSE